MYDTCRDIKEICKNGCPVWTKDVCPSRSRNDFIFGTINELNVITGITIKKMI